MHKKAAVAFSKVFVCLHAAKKLSFTVFARFFFSQSEREFEKYVENQNKVKLQDIILIIFNETWPWMDRGQTKKIGAQFFTSTFHSWSSQVRSGVTHVPDYKRDERLRPKVTRSWLGPILFSNDHPAMQYSTFCHCLEYWLYKKGVSQFQVHKIIIVRLQGGSTVHSLQTRKTPCFGRTEYWEYCLSCRRKTHC